MYCDKKLVLRNTRDIERKKFCSQICKGIYNYPRCHPHTYITKGTREKQSVTMKRVWKDKPHPMLGKYLSEKTKQKISESQKIRAKLRPESFPRGENHPFWKGGRKLNRGYIDILAKGHPRANKNGYIREHTIVAEKILGRFLENNEVVHHINEIKNDNRPENLKVMDRGVHSIWHHKTVA